MSVGHPLQGSLVEQNIRTTNHTKLGHHIWEPTICETKSLFGSSLIRSKISDFTELVELDFRHSVKMAYGSLRSALLALRSRCVRRSSVRSRSSVEERRGSEQGLILGFGAPFGVFIWAVRQVDWAGGWIGPKF